MTDKKNITENIALTNAQAQDFVNALAESAIMKDQLDAYGALYEKLDRKYPLKDNKNKDDG